MRLPWDIIVSDNAYINLDTFGEVLYEQVSTYSNMAVK